MEVEREDGEFIWVNGKKYARVTATLGKYRNFVGIPDGLESMRLSTTISWGCSTNSRSQKRATSEATKYGSIKSGPLSLNPKLGMSAMIR